MPTEQMIQLPERMRVVVTLAGLLEKIEADPRAGGADQYRSIVRHLVEELGRLETDAALEWVLGVFPATSALYENLRYQQAGLCRTPLELSLNSELEARAVIDRADESLWATAVLNVRLTRGACRSEVGGVDHCEKAAKFIGHRSFESAVLLDPCIAGA